MSDSDSSVTSMVDYDEFERGFDLARVKKRLLDYVRSIYNVKIEQLHEVRRVLSEPNLSNKPNLHSRFDQAENRLLTALEAQDRIYTVIEHTLERRNLLHSPLLETTLQDIKNWEDSLNPIIADLISIRKTAIMILDAMN